MNTKIYTFFIIVNLLISGCTEKKDSRKTPFIWEGANLYFLLTDRFYDGDKSNNINYSRNEETGVLRGFEGGDIRGIIQKIDDGYFRNLGINAIWFTPVVEQIHGNVDEGTGVSYGFHGYWAKDWTALDPNFGSNDDLKELIKKAHNQGIRIVMDVVINHTGPVTPIDEQWPDQWVRTSPKCEFNSYQTTVECTLVENLPDIKTESDEEVTIPDYLITKWKKEGRYNQEMEELDEFFIRTGYPRAPRYYIIKWLTDYIAEFGIDAFRADTVKHLEESVWNEFKIECEYAFDLWKNNNPSLVLDKNNFFLLGEVYNFNVSNAKVFDFGDKTVNYYDHGFDAMINFEFKSDANQGYEFIFSKYSNILNNEIPNSSVLNYLTSHDDGSPFDKNRTRPYETATKMLLSPGISQIYYGDETARPLIIDGAKGDATLRSFMNWSDLEKNDEIKKLNKHWQKLGKFRKNHPAIGAGVHQMILDNPYVFSRSLITDDFSDNVIIGLDLVKGKKEIPVSSKFKNGDLLLDKYSNQQVKVENGFVVFNSPNTIVLLELF